MMYCKDDRTPKTVVEAHAALGEGALWSTTENKLYWINIEGRELHEYDPASGSDKVFPVAERIGTVVESSEGGVVVALQNGIYSLDTQTGSMSFVVNPLPDSSIRFNDGKCDPSGRFWVGSMALDQRAGAASLYRLDSRGVQTMLDSVTISNGIVWTSDKKTMYYNDTPTGVVQAFDYNNETGAISNRRVAVEIPKGMGSPDGMAIDSEDKIWVALWGGSCVARFDPATGKLMSKIDVPAPNVTSCAFGGPDLRTLYITTARVGMSEEQLEQFPGSGNVFSIETDVRGVASTLFDQK